MWPDVATEGSGPSSERAGAGLEPLTGLGWLVSGKDVAVASLKVGEEIVVPLKVSLADHRQPALAPLRALLLFDIDGVIRDVGRSYRLAVTETVAHFSGWRPTPGIVDALKAEGCWNNDWDASLELLRRRRSRQPNLQLPPRDVVAEVFSGFYFGRDDDGAVSRQPHRWTGLVRQEPLLVDGAFFAALGGAGIGWGFVSGAEPPSARHVLEDRLGLPQPPLVAMGDAPDKPDPTGLLQLAEELAATAHVPLAQLPMGYVGDTVADVLTVIRARRQYPRLRCKALAVAPPHVAAAGAAACAAYHHQLLAAGADAVIGATAALRPERVFQLLRMADSRGKPGDMAE